MRRIDRFREHEIEGCRPVARASQDCRQDKDLIHIWVCPGNSSPYVPWCSSAVFGLVSKLVYQTGGRCP